MAEWACENCTFANQPGTSICDICGKSRDVGASVLEGKEGKEGTPNAPQHRSMDNPNRYAAADALDDDHASNPNPKSVKNYFGECHT